MEVYVSRKFCIYSLSMKFLCDASDNTDMYNENSKYKTLVSLQRLFVVLIFC